MTKEKIIATLLDYKKEDLRAKNELNQTETEELDQFEKRLV